jgi:hypothetical protein
MLMHVNCEFVFSNGINMAAPTAGRTYTEDGNEVTRKISDLRKRKQQKNKENYTVKSFILYSLQSVIRAVTSRMMGWRVYRACSMHEANETCVQAFSW